MRSKTVKNNQGFKICVRKVHQRPYIWVTGETSMYRTHVVVTTCQARQIADALNQMADEIDGEQCKK